MSRFGIIFAIVVIAVGSYASYYLINKFGKTNKELGITEEKASSATIAIETVAKDLKEINRINNESKNMDKQAVINDLLNLGVLRDNENY